MIITCPDCTTRYDVDDARFSPNGRSVRCSSCGESWFVPAPELIDVPPMDEKPAKRRKAPARAAKADDDGDDAPRIKVGFADKDEDDEPRQKPAKKPATTKARAAAKAAEDAPAPAESRSAKKPAAVKKTAAAARDDDDADFLDDDDDQLFDTRPSSRPAPHQAPRRAAPKREVEEDEPAPGKTWRKGRQFVVEEEDNERANRSFFARKSKVAGARAQDRDDERRSGERLRFADEDAEPAPRRGADAFDEFVPASGAYVVDADWEDVDDNGERSRGFGRRVRAERRRATALARMEDVRPLDPGALDEQFFASLRVTPRELERAIRTARRRAEARDKNRLTPLRVIGWLAWTAAIIGAGYGVVAYRDDIVKMAPKTADAYAVIGIAANPYGLTIENVHHRLAMSTGGPTIEITGNLRNETDKPVSAPLLQAEALGPKGELLARWTFSAKEGDVAIGGAVDFTTRASAPDGVSEVALSFAPDRAGPDAKSK